MGFFTDVGVNYVLSRLRGRIGYYLGMTGSRLRGEEVVVAGLAHFFVQSKDLPQVKMDLEEALVGVPAEGVKGVVCKVLLKYNRPPAKKTLDN